MVARVSHNYKQKYRHKSNNQTTKNSIMLRAHFTSSLAFPVLFLFLSLTLACDPEYMDNGEGSCYRKSIGKFVSCLLLYVRIHAAIPLRKLCCVFRMVAGLSALGLTRSRSPERTPMSWGQCLSFLPLQRRYCNIFLKHFVHIWNNEGHIVQQIDLYLLHLYYSCEATYLWNMELW